MCRQAGETELYIACSARVRMSMHEEGDGKTAVRGKDFFGFCVSERIYERLSRRGSSPLSLFS